VLGSFVIDTGGELIDTNLPAAFDAGVFSEAGPRIIRLVEASSALANGLKSCVLRFAEHKLFVKELNGAFLGVLLGVNASVPALKVAANIVARRIEPLLTGEAPRPSSYDVEIHGPDTHRSSGVPGSGRTSQPPPLPQQGTRPSSPPPAPELKQGMMYRGRKLT
jgi:hypothetical protein